MNPATESLSATGEARTASALIDACVYHDWAAGALLPYLTGDWGQLLEGRALLAPGPQRDPRMDQNATSEVGGVGFEYDTVRERHFDVSGATHFVLQYDDGLLATIHPHHYIARALVSAANDWTRDEWLARDERLYAVILISSTLPESAAEEIRRVGADHRFVGIALGGNGLNKPFGHPIYHPIYEAAAELGLPIVLQVGPERSYDETVQYVAGGTPATFVEWRANCWQTHAAHVTSLIAQGVFQLYPDLRIVLHGSGALWMPGHLGRMDYWARMMPRDAPWLDRLPSEYFTDHFRLTTYGLELPADQDKTRFHRALSTLPSGREVLVYASGFGTIDSEPIRRWRALLPEDWHAATFAANALEVFRWPSSEAPTSTPAKDPDNS